KAGARVSPGRWQSGPSHPDEARNSRASKAVGRRPAPIRYARCSMPVGSILGRAVRRSEDPRFLTGAATYTEDIPAEGALWAAFEPGAPILFPPAETNVAREERWESRAGDPLEGAEVVIRARLRNQRVAPLPMEPNALLAVPDPDTGGLRVWVPNQAPFWFRD